jgi:hypothetical protein
MANHYKGFERIKEIKKLADKYRKECPMNVRAVNDWIVNRIYESPAPRYYVSFEEARRQVSKILRDKPLTISNKPTVKMYKDLAEKVKKYNIEHNKDILSFECLFDILDNPAESFYLSKYTICAIITRANYGK